MLRELDPLLRQAGGAALSCFRSTAAQLKSDGTHVTEADRRSEEILVEGLARLFPRDAITGEEGTKIEGGEGTWFVDPIAPIMAGTMADYVTEPAMASNTWLSQTFGGLVGTGPGSGMALQYIVSGLGWIAIILVASFLPVIRNVEDNLPDHDQLEKAGAAAATAAVEEPAEAALAQAT